MITIFLPDNPAIRLGVTLVLLVPCTDWHTTFSHLAEGDTSRAIAATPMNLLVQPALLPVYLWLFMGDAFLELLAAPSGSALVFSLGTRNSFVIFLLALALAPEWQTATVMIVFQSLIELFGMATYLWLVPRLLAVHSIGATR